jgi:hypothetical protein
VWARGYFCRSSGNVTDEVIKAYIAQQCALPERFAASPGRFAITSKKGRYCVSLRPKWFREGLLEALRTSETTLSFLGLFFL